MPTLHWVGKNKVVNHHHDVPFRLLEKQYSFAAEEGAPINTTNNKIIHGDNLEALKSLLPEFEGKVNCIYIDPPYNTGNEGWVYNDNVNDPKIKKWLGQVVGKEGEDLSRHDKWLCMIYPRLKLLHRLLADDGVIFVSIDDNEQANLKLVMDDIFGYRNCLGPIIQEKGNSKSDASNVQKNHEFVLIYAKSNTQSRAILKNTKKVEKRIFVENDEYYYLNDPITTRGDGGTLNNRENLGYTVYFNPESKDMIAKQDYDLVKAKVSNKEKEVYQTDQVLVERGYVPIRPPKVRKQLGAWTWDLNKFAADKKNIVVTGSGDSMTLRKRTFVDKSIVFEKKGELFCQVESEGNSKSIQSFPTSEGTILLNEVMNQPDLFQNPKNINLIEYLISLVDGKKALVLDSFAGSGTTGHAVLNLNSKDRGKRRFILCEMMDYAETITAERVRRVINGYGEGDKQVEGTGGGFEFYTVGTSLFKEDKNLNEEVGATAIRDYVAYTENIPTEKRWNTENTVSPYALGSTDSALCVFYYEKDRVTTLDIDFLGQLKIKNLLSRPEQFVIYADKCALDKDFLYKHGITFKRIPRDITRF